MLSSDLNAKQIEAVEHVEGPMLVLAGAGSGKTRVVSHRIAHLIDLGVLPSDILAVTFTNKAAEEMRARIKRMKNAYVLTCTFHSLGARILRESIQPFGYSSDFTIYDQEDSLKLLKNCMQSLGIKEEKGLLKGVKIRISSAKNDVISPDKIKSSQQGSKADQLFPKLYPLYQARLKENNALDFDDLLYLTVKLLQENEDMRNIYQSRWLFILIDEYQDTNYAQYSLAKFLAHQSGNIFAVGDPDQSIYSWRGARYQNILRFEEDFPGSKIITLEQNYRSTQNILKGANALIEHNHERYEKNLWSKLAEGEKIKVYLAQNDRQEAEFVAEQILEKHMDFHIPLKDIVIFYRTNSQSRALEDLFLTKQIPYRIVGALSFYQRKEIKDVLSILKMVLSNADFISFSRSLLLSPKGIGQTTLSKMIHKAQQMQIPIFTLCEKHLLENDSPKLNVKQKQGLTDYIQSIKTLRLHNGSISELIKLAVDKFHYWSVLQEDPETFEDRKQNIEELISKAAQWEEEHSNPSLSQFLEELTLISDRETQDHHDAVQFMTVHNGKGLEFSLVFIIGLEEDLFPHANCKDFPENLEEERRLAYVAMTRAKKILFLCGAYYRYIWGSQKLMQPSRFLKEIPADYLENLSPTSIEKPSIYQENVAGFRVGDLVVHKEFGVGKVQKVYQTTYGPTYDVFFEELKGTRSLVGKFAKLQRWV